MDVYYYVNNEFLITYYDSSAWAKIGEKVEYNGIEYVAIDLIHVLNSGANQIRIYLKKQ